MADLYPPLRGLGEKLTPFQVIYTEPCSEYINWSIYLITVSIHYDYHYGIYLVYITVFQSMVTYCKTDMCGQCFHFWQCY